MKFNDFVARDEAKLSLILNAIDGNCGGVLFIGKSGSGKTTLSRLFKEILPPQVPFVEVPLNATEEALLGFIDIEETIKKGMRIYENGILGRANNGFLFIDDINLLPRDIIAIILNAREEKRYFVEREGLSLVIPTNFVPIATMNPIDGMLPSHLLDKFGMCVVWDELRGKEERIKVIKSVCDDIFPSPSLPNYLPELIMQWRETVKTIKVPDEMQELIVDLCEKFGVSSHRGEIFLFYASRAYAAYVGAQEVREEHIYAVFPLVFHHRVDHSIEEAPENSSKDDEEGEQEEEKHTHNHKEDKQMKRDIREMPPMPEGREIIIKEAIPKEEIMEVGEPYRIKRLIFPRDRVERKGSGRRTGTRSKGRQGRYIKASLSGDNRDIAIDATIRAAAPFQRLRGGGSEIVIREEDLRFKKRERKTSHLFLFVVDASGSMGVKRRMVETKTAIKSILMDCYQKRDKVAMIAFRKDKAELVLPPCSSLELADKKLAKLPIGGKTPLSAGLWEAYKLTRRERIKEATLRITVLIITDGKANQSMGGKSVKEEIAKLTSLLRTLQGVDYIVVDTEDKRGLFKTDLGIWIANLLKARYIPMEELKADRILALLPSDVV
jgi:magnesium chelatase subunit D